MHVIKKHWAHRGCAGCTKGVLCALGEHEGGGIRVVRGTPQGNAWPVGGALGEPGSAQGAPGWCTGRIGLVSGTH